MKVGYIFEMFKSALTGIKWKTQKLTNGMLVQYSGDVIEKDDIVFLLSESGSPSSPADGKYKLEDGTVYLMKDGKVSDVIQKANTAPAQSEQPIKQAMSEEIQPAEIKIENIMSTEIKEATIDDKAPVIAPDTKDTETESPANEKAEEVDLAAIIAKALEPVLASIQKLTDSLSTSQTEMSKTKEEMSEVKKTVEKLSNESAPEIKEVKIIENPFNKKEEFKDSRTAAILRS